jgi:hypothetical protein
MAAAAAIAGRLVDVRREDVRRDLPGTPVLSAQIH